MNQRIKEALLNLEWTSQNVANVFKEKYYGKKEVEAWWVADEIGGVYFINDNFYELNQMVDFLKYKFPQKKMFEYMEYNLEMYEKGETPWNIKTYKYVK